MTDQQTADWVRDTCLTFGTSVATAYQVAGIFMAGIETAGRNDLSPDNGETRG